MNILSKLDELQKIAEKATPGPWNNECFIDSVHQDSADGGYERTICTDCYKKDSDFIATFNPAVAIELIAALKEAHNVIKIIAQGQPETEFAKAFLEKHGKTQ